MPIDRGDHNNKSSEPTALQRSYLDVAVHAAIDPVVRSVASESRAKIIEGEVTGYTKAFIKTAPLFMKGELALGGLALTYMADEAKVGDSASHQIADATLGLGKAAALKGSFALMESRGLSPALKGIELGIVSRSAETGLTRENYLTKDGKFSLSGGLHKTAETALNPGSLAVDALTFGAAEVAWGRLYSSTRGAIRYNTPLNQMIAAGVMGTASGTGQEFVRQYQSPEKFDLPLIMERGFAQGAVNAAAGRLGGMQAERYLKLPGQDAPGAMNQARSNAFQTGELGDARQMALRDGVFTAGREVGNLMTPTWKGIVQTAEGNTPVLFRPHTETEAFAHRMQSEIAGYGLGGKLKFENSVPVSVARTVEINGRKVSGYVQELQGKSLLDEVNPDGPRSLFKAPSKQVIENFVQNKPLFESYQEAWAQRVIMGEWDNHSLNFITDKTAGKTVVKNIDLGDGLRPASSQLDLIPNSGMRRGWENLNQYLYKKAAEQALPASTMGKINDFVSTYANPAGKQELQGLGLTQQQVEGAVGRAEWLARHGRLPKSEMEPTVYRLATQVYKLLRGRNPATNLSYHNLADDGPKPVVSK